MGTERKQNHKLIEGVWDCKGCGTVRILGRHRECPHCGKVRDSNTKFYMSDKKMYVPEEKAKEISRKPDWVCRFCDCLNPDTTDTCKSCGASRTAENKNYFENRAEKDKQKAEQDKRIAAITGTPETVSTSETTPVETPITTSVEAPVEESISHDEECHHDYHQDVPNEDIQNEEPIYEAPTINVPERSNSLLSSAVEVVKDFFEEYGGFVLGAVAVILVILGCVLLLKPKTENVTIDLVSWERTIEVERFQTLKESDWTVPEGARVYETKEEVSGHVKVVDHYETKTRKIKKERIVGYDTVVVDYKDLGNGYFDEITEEVPIYETYYETEEYKDPVYRSDPVYSTKYYYEIDKWLHERNLVAWGNDKSPEWPDTSCLKADERTAGQKEEYTITYTNEKGKMKTVSLPYSQWNDLMAGDKVTIKVSVFGNAEIV